MATKIFPDIVQCMRLREAGYQGTTNFAWCVIGGDLRTAFLVNTEVRKDDGHYPLIPAPSTDELLAAILDRREAYQKCAFIDHGANGFEVGLHQNNCPPLSVECQCIVDGLVDVFVLLSNETPDQVRRDGVDLKHNWADLVVEPVPDAPKDAPKNFFVGVK